MLDCKNLEFKSLANEKTCIYVGPLNPFYSREKINYQELSTMTFIQ